MTIKGKGPFSKNRVPTNGGGGAVKAPAVGKKSDSTPPETAEAAAVDRFEDTGATRPYSGEGDHLVGANSRPSAKRSFHKLVAKTERKLVAEHGELQSGVDALLEEMRGGKDVAAELSPLRRRLTRVRRRLATLRRRRAQLDIGTSLQPDLRLGLELLDSAAAKVAHVAQLKPGGIDVIDAPDDPQKAATELAKGGRSARVTRFLLQTLTGDAGPEAKADLDHPRAADLDQIDAALIG